MAPLSGIWLPIITPFTDDAVDIPAYRKLIRHYMDLGISGLIPLGTTGESPCITEPEYHMIIENTLEAVNHRVPVYVGLSGNFTRHVLDRIRSIEKSGIDGILSVCPYYNKPSQEGLFQHFLRISEATPLDVIIYNIPHRTGINLENETLLRLAEQPNIVGVKDSCGNISQSLDLLMTKPSDFSVLTGEDRMFYTLAANGGEGGILAAAHLGTRHYVDTFSCLQKNDHHSALAQWRRIEGLIPLLFEEPNPGPIKYGLNHIGLIPSDAVRLPLTQISDGLKNRLQVYLE